MILTKNNKTIEVSSSLFDKVITGERSVTINVNKNCCGDTLVKTLTSADLVGSSKILVKDHIYYPYSSSSKFVSLGFVVNGSTSVTYQFQPTTNFSIYTQIADILSSFTAFKALNTVFANTTLAITNSFGSIEILLTNLPAAITVSECRLLSGTSQNYFGELPTIKPIFYTYTFTEDGIYNFTLKSTDAITNSSTTESKCISVLDDIKCLIPNNIISNSKSIAHLLYQSIVDAQECNCICDEMCKLYDSLIEEIKWN